ncbi:hypothetical protein [Caballeronia hypogeia]|uniref:hypothetical protein n=1 Tax=Caballeronia hypogeia TaxID=1777140 RepID=UPI0012FE3A37|nr:hypothetical protein [Caballeronia hypogeia]
MNDIIRVTESETEGRAASHAISRQPNIAAQRYISSPYELLLQPPMAALASNTSDRADVRSIAILGYN